MSNRVDQPKYSLEKMHEPKLWGERRNGKTVDAIVLAIGAVMVTEKEIIPIVVPFLNRAQYMAHVFKDLCENHFQEIPVILRETEWTIKGYSSKIRIVSEATAHRDLLGIAANPIYDL